VRVPCPQCGADIRLREAAGFPVCPYCSASLVLDRSGVRRHFLYRPRIRAAEVLPLVRRWADRQRLPAPSPIAPPRLIFRPFWRYAVRGAVRFVPAWETLSAHWDGLATPEAEQIFFDPEEVRGASLEEASVPEQSARRRQGLPDDRVGELVHLPFFELDAAAGSFRATLVLDACSGRIYTDRHEAGTAAAARQFPDRGVLLSAGGMLLASVALPLLLAIPALGGLAVWLWTLLAADRRPG
jgi:hypothetical protein